MNYKVICAWTPVIYMIGVFVINFTCGPFFPIWFKRIYDWVFIILPLFPNSIFIIFNFIRLLGSPKNELPFEINIITFSKDINCERINRNKFLVHSWNKDIEFNMQGWLFKKRHLRDILLMYYHIHYYNSNKIPAYKVTNNKFFKGKNLSLLITNKNGKIKKIHLIKNGKEKRSFLFYLKVGMYTYPLIGIRKYSSVFEHHAALIGFYYVSSPINMLLWC